MFVNAKDEPAITAEPAKAVGSSGRTPPFYRKTGLMASTLRKTTENSVKHKKLFEQREFFLCSGS
jgi:hypothetical protein